MIAIGDAYCTECGTLAPVTISGALMRHGSLDAGECPAPLTHR